MWHSLRNTRALNSMNNHLCGLSLLEACVACTHGKTFLKNPQHINSYKNKFYYKYVLANAIHTMLGEELNLIWSLHFISLLTAIVISHQIN